MRSLVSRVRVQKSLGLLPTHLLVKPDPGVSADYWFLDSGCRAQGSRAHFSLLQGGSGEELVPDTVGSGVWGVPQVALAC